MSEVGLSVTAYTDHDKQRWDDFVGRSRNGTFLFFRDYMDYHADRFPDASLMAIDGGGTVRALLPATRSGGELTSHAGLTYGGFVIDERLTVGSMLELVDVTLAWLEREGITSLVYKCVPHIYHRTPAEEDRYALFRHGAELYRRDLLSVIDYRVDVARTIRRRREKIRKAVRDGIELRETDEYSRFWPILAANLERRYGVQPVHTPSEMELLAARFPEHIRLVGAHINGTLEAGLVLYVSDQVCHVQYSGSSPDAQRLGVVDLVYAYVIETFAPAVRYFDFGISTERDGHFLNAGLVQFKEKFGARSVVHDTYRVVV